MDPKPSSSLAMLAPGHASASALHCPNVDGPFPRVDDHIVEPETRQEMLRGVLMEVQPANPPHAERQVDLAYVIRAHVAPGYIGADDLLTRFSHQSNFATDVCLRKEGIDPDTGARYLEELAFEIVSEQSMRHITMRAEDIVNRGVRRLIALFIKKGRVAEWSREHDSFEDLPLDGMLEDRTLTRPIPIRALLEASIADETVARGLLEKGVPVLVQRQRDARNEGLYAGRKEGLYTGRQEGRQEGRRQGLHDALILTLAARGLHPDDRQAAALQACADEAKLARWLLLASQIESIEELFVD